VTVTLSTGQVRTTTADDEGAWSVVFERVPEGEWTISATQSVNGTTSAAPQVPIVVDTLEPLAVTSPTPGSQYMADEDGDHDLMVTG
ncbi:hypothetical protein KSI87_21265, partial [Dickeya zeae]